MRAVLFILMATLFAGAGHRSFAVEIFVEFGWNIIPYHYHASVFPQHIAIKAGDTVTWLYKGGWPSTNYLRSFGAEWQTPDVVAGTSVSVLFTNSGFYGYHTAAYGNEDPYHSADPLHTVSTITVHPSDESPQAVWLAAPIDGPSYRRYAQPPMRFLAGVNFPRDEIERVEFYVDSMLLGAVEVPPYYIDVSSEAFGQPQPVAHARLIHKSGLTHFSRPVRLRIGSQLCSFLHVLPKGEVLFHVAAPRGRGQIEYSENLSSWQLLDTIFDEGVVIDETAKAAPRRFYRWHLQNPP